MDNANYLWNGEEWCLVDSIRYGLGGRTFIYMLWSTCVWYDICHVWRKAGPYTWPRSLFQVLNLLSLNYHYGCCHRPPSSSSKDIGHLPVSNFKRIWRPSSYGTVFKLLLFISLVLSTGIRRSRFNTNTSTHQVNLIAVLDFRLSQWWGVSRLKCQPRDWLFWFRIFMWFSLLIHYLFIILSFAITRSHLLKDSLNEP